MKNQLRVLLTIMAVILSLTAILTSCDESEADVTTPAETEAVETPEETAESPHAHTWSNWTTSLNATCTSEGSKERTCACGEKETQPISVIGHAEVIDAAVAPTCTTAGKTEGKHCSVCNMILVKQSAINALGHTEEVISGKAATCTDTGLTNGKKCSVCGVVTVEQAEIPTIGHNYENAVCTVCGKTLSASEGLEFTLNSNKKSYTVAGIGTCAYTELVIPTSYKGFPVTAIKDYAFYDCDDLVSIYIPDNVTVIGKKAFGSCNNLISVYISDSVSEIGKYAFSYCRSLASITVAPGNTVYHSEGNCIIQTSSKTLISGCKTSVIPDDGSVTSIGDYAFHDSGVESIVVPGSVKLIGAYAFEGSILKSITIEEGVEEIGANAFRSCPYLNSVNISESVETIGESAFYFCTGLKSVVIPNGVKTIGENAFYKCALRSLTIGSGTTYIGSYAFSECSSLTNITVNPGNTVYHSAGNCLIETASKTVVLLCKSSVIPSDGSVTAIGKCPFSYGRNITNFKIPDCITKIGEYAFAGLFLKNITIPDSVEEIGNKAFLGCIFMETVTIGNGVKTIGERAFSGCESLTSVTISNSVKSIGDRAFDSCFKLTTVTIGNSVQSIGKEAFRSTSLTDIVIPDSVTSIGKGAFSHSTLSSITIGNGVTTIESEVFAGCRISSVSFGKNVASIHQDAFSDCPRLESITVDANNKVFHSSGNCLIETASKTLVLGCKTSIIPSDGSVTCIGSYSFANCTTLIIPEGVTEVSHHAFWYCTNLTSLVIPKSMKVMGHTLFGYESESNVKNVYYSGTEEEWLAAQIGHREFFINKIHYNYTP